MFHSSSGSDLATSLLSVNNVQRAVSPGSLVHFTQHAKLKWAGTTIKGGTVIVYQGTVGVVVARVDSVIEVAHCFVLQHRRYTSGIMEVNGQRCVVADSLELVAGAIELYTCGMTVAFCYPQGQHLVLVL